MAAIPFDNMGSARRIEYEDDAILCIVCKGVAKWMCSKCRAVYYCSDCGKRSLHWKHHKQTCLSAQKRAPTRTKYRHRHQKFERLGRPPQPNPETLRMHEDSPTTLNAKTVVPPGQHCGVEVDATRPLVCMSPGVRWGVTREEPLGFLPLVTSKNNLGSETSSLGKGTYGKVWSLRTDKGDEIAVKAMELSSDGTITTDGIRELFARELDCVNVSGICKAAFLEDDEVTKGATDSDAVPKYFAIVMDSAQMDLHKYVELSKAERKAKNKRGALSKREMKSFAYQLLRGLACIHSALGLHLDLKASNILVTGVAAPTGTDGRRDVAKCLKITDFGLSHSFYTHPTDLDKNTTLIYTAPELAGGAHLFSQKADVWAMGCVLYSMARGRHLFSLGEEEYDDDGLIQAIVRKVGNPPVTEDVRELFPSVDFQDSAGSDNFEQKIARKVAHYGGLSGLLKRMLAVNPRERISTFDALDHPYFDKATKEYIERALPVDHTKMLRLKYPDGMTIAPSSLLEALRMKQAATWFTSGSTSKERKSVFVYIMRLCTAMRDPVSFSVVQTALEIAREYFRIVPERDTELRQKEQRALAVACLIIAAKLRTETGSLMAVFCCYAFDVHISTDAIAAEERRVLHAIDYNMAIVTVYDFVDCLSLSRGLVLQDWFVVQCFGLMFYLVPKLRENVTPETIAAFAMALASDEDGTRLGEMLSRYEDTKVIKSALLSVTKSVAFTKYVKRKDLSVPDFERYIDSIGRKQE